MTLSAWVYPTTWASGWKSLLMKESSGGLAYALSSNSDAGQPDGTVRIGGSDRQLAAGSHLPNNTWTHLAATYDGTTQRLFVNGVQVGSRAQTGTLEISANPLRIGGNTVWANEYFQGLIDEVRVYNRAFSQRRSRRYPRSRWSNWPRQPVSAPPRAVCGTVPQPQVSGRRRIPGR
jgi:hypothetical protein